MPMPYSVLLLCLYLCHVVGGVHHSTTPTPTQTHSASSKLSLTPTPDHTISQSPPFRTWHTYPIPPQGSMDMNFVVRKLHDEPWLYADYVAFSPQQLQFPTARKNAVQQYPLFHPVSWSCSASTPHQYRAYDAQFVDTRHVIAAWLHVNLPPGQYTVCYTLNGEWIDSGGHWYPLLVAGPFGFTAPTVNNGVPLSVDIFGYALQAGDTVRIVVSGYACNGSVADIVPAVVIGILNLGGATNNTVTIVYGTGIPFQGDYTVCYKSRSIWYQLPGTITITGAVGLGAAPTGSSSNTAAWDGKLLPLWIVLIVLGFLLCLTCFAILIFCLFCKRRSNPAIEDVKGLPAPEPEPVQPSSTPERVRIAVCGLRDDKDSMVSGVVEVQLDKSVAHIAHRSPSSPEAEGQPTGSCEFPWLFENQQVHQDLLYFYVTHDDAIIKGTPPHTAIRISHHLLPNYKIRSCKKWWDVKDSEGKPCGRILIQLEAVRIGEDPPKYERVIETPPKPAEEKPDVLTIEASPSAGSRSVAPQYPPVYDMFPPGSVLNRYGNPLAPSYGNPVPYPQPHYVSTQPVQFLQSVPYPHAYVDPRPVRKSKWYNMSTE